MKVKTTKTFNGAADLSGYLKRCDQLNAGYEIKFSLSGRAKETGKLTEKLRHPKRKNETWSIGFLVVEMVVVVKRYHNIQFLLNNYTTVIIQHQN